MQIKITIRYKENKVNIQVPSKQRLKTTFEVLEEYKGYEFSNITNMENIRLEKNGRILDKNKTYEELKIYDGDVIRINNN